MTQRAHLAMQPERGVVKLPAASATRIGSARGCEGALGAPRRRGEGREGGLPSAGGGPGQSRVWILKGLSDTDMQRGRSLQFAILEGLTVKFKSEVDTNGTNRRPVSYTESSTTSDPGQTQVANTVVHVAAIEKPDNVDRGRHVGAKLTVND